MKTKTLYLEMTCMASYQSEIEVPLDYTLEEAKEYAKEHLDEIPVHNLEWLQDQEDCLDGDMDLWEFNE